MDKIKSVITNLRTNLPFPIVNNAATAHELFGPMIYSAYATFLQSSENPHLGMSHPEAIVLNPFTLGMESGAQLMQTLFHELGHATGTKERLNRPMDTVTVATVNSPSREYAFEELIADTTSDLLMTHFDLHTPETQQQINDYRRKYSSMFEDPTAVIERALIKAEEAKNYILNNWMKVAV